MEKTIRAIMIVGEFLAKVNPDIYEKGAAVFFFGMNWRKESMLEHIGAAMMPRKVERLAEVEMKEAWGKYRSPQGINISLEEANNQIVVEEYEL